MSVSLDLGRSGELCLGFDIVSKRSVSGWLAVAVRRGGTGGNEIESCLCNRQDTRDSVAMWSRVRQRRSMTRAENSRRIIKQTERARLRAFNRGVNDIC